MKYAENDYMSKVNLDMLRIEIEQRISKYDIALHHIEVHRHVDEMLNAVVLNFRAFCLCEKQKPISVGTYPSSWWQMFKRDIMPQWFINKFPVKTKSIEIDATVLYPHLKISVPQNQSTATVIFNKRINCII